MQSIEMRRSILFPLAETFDYLTDIANHSEFCDHYLVDWRLTREDALGVGAGARFKLKQRFTRFGWADVTVAETQSNALIVLRGRGGMNGRVRFIVTWRLMQMEAGETEVSLCTEVQSEHVVDQILFSLFGIRWLKRGAKRSLKRLQSILETGKGAGLPVTIAGGPRKPATRLSRPRIQA